MESSGRRSLKKFILRLKAEGVDQDRLSDAGRAWAQDYRRGVRDAEQLARAGRYAMEAGFQATLGDLQEVDSPESQWLDLEQQQWLDEQTAPLSSPDLTGGMGADDLLEYIESEVIAVPEVEEIVAPVAAGATVADLPVDATRADFTPEAMAEAGWGNQERAAALASGGGPSLDDLLDPSSPENQLLDRQSQRWLDRQTAPQPGDTLQAPGTTKDAGGEWGNWKEIASPLVGLAGAALGAMRPGLERDRAYEARLRARMGGDTLARREGALAAGQLNRSIRGASLGRRDISPALAMRNAQMTAARAGTNVMAQAAIASAQERQRAEETLAKIRKDRISSQIDAGLAALSQGGAWLAGQGAAEAKGGGNGGA